MAYLEGPRGGHDEQHVLELLQRQLRQGRHLAARGAHGSHALRRLLGVQVERGGRWGIGQVHLHHLQHLQTRERGEFDRYMGKRRRARGPHLEPELVEGLEQQQVPQVLQEGLGHEGQGKLPRLERARLAKAHSHSVNVNMRWAK